MTTAAGQIIYPTLLVAATVAHHISCTPPKIAKESSDHLLNGSDERKDKTQSNSQKEALHGPRRFNQIGMMGVACSKYVVWVITALELAARSTLLFSPATTTSPTVFPRLSPKPSMMFMLSILSISIGFLIRRACFAAMGRHFSFTHTTLAGHQLIKSGPYGIVRHPSYTGELLVRGGMVALLLASGGLVRSCGALQQHYIGSLDVSQQALRIIVRSCVAYYIGWATFGCTYLILRAPLEDATLRETFGKEWDAYSKEVPHRFVPYVA